MNIGFDLDKVFVNYPPFIPDSLIDRLYRKKANGVLLYRIPSTPEQLLRKITHLPNFRPPITHNIEAVKNIEKKNHKYFLISSRYKFLEKMTYTLLKHYKLDELFDKTFFNFDNKQPHEFKNKVIKDMKIDRYVDDDLYLLKYVAKQNPKTTFFWLNKKINNKLHKNIYAITHISDIMK